MNSTEIIKALSFDCYGTLINWESGILEALSPWVVETDLPVEKQHLLETYGRFETLIESEFPQSPYPEVLVRTLRRMGTFYEVPVRDEIAADFGASVGRWPAFPDSVKALRRLKERYRLIILSNVDRGSFYLSNTRLGIEFDLIVTAQDVGAYKPSPLSFQALFDRLGSIGLSRENLLHVAQSLYHDHEPAQKVSLPSVWIDRRHGKKGSGATPEPGPNLTEVKWRYDSMETFADAILEAGLPEQPPNLNNS